jgi:hypothetical protein
VKSALPEDETEMPLTGAWRAVNTASKVHFLWIYRWACSSPRFEGSHFSLVSFDQSRKILLGLLDTKLKELCLFETSEIACPTTRHHTQKNRIASYVAVNPFIVSQDDSKNYDAVGLLRM